jgi:hypothetical protein
MILQAMALLIKHVICTRHLASARCRLGLPADLQIDLCLCCAEEGMQLGSRSGSLPAPAVTDLANASMRPSTATDGSGLFRRSVSPERGHQNRPPGTDTWQRAGEEGLADKAPAVADGDMRMMPSAMSHPDIMVPWQRAGERTSADGAHSIEAEDMSTAAAQSRESVMMTSSVMSASWRSLPASVFAADTQRGFDKGQGEGFRKAVENKRSSATSSGASSGAREWDRVGQTHSVHALCSPNNNNNNNDNNSANPKPVRP